MIVLPEISQWEAPDFVAGRIMDSLREPFPVNGHKLAVTASIGISIFPDHGENTHTLMKKADIAMYRAKGEGRNISRYFEDEDEVKETQLQEV